MAIVVVVQGNVNLSRLMVRLVAVLLNRLMAVVAVRLRRLMVRLVAVLLSRLMVWLVAVLLNRLIAASKAYQSSSGSWRSLRGAWQRFGID
jgi:hypothetical protein